MESDRLGRLLKLKQQQHLVPLDEETKEKISSHNLPFDEAGKLLTFFYEYIRENWRNSHVDDTIIHIINFPDTLIIEYICKCLSISDIISLEQTCIRFAIICRQPESCKHIKIEYQNIYKKLVDFMNNKLSTKGSEEWPNILPPDLYRFKQIKYLYMIFPKTMASALIFKAFSKQLNGAELNTVSIERFDNDYCPITGKELCHQIYYQLFTKCFPKFKSVKNLNVSNYHKDINFTFLDLIISRSPKLDSLNIENIQIYDINTFFNVMDLAMVFCRINERIEDSYEYIQTFTNLKMFKYQQRNDLIHHHDAYLVYYILEKSIENLKSLYLNINLFAYGHGICSKITLPELNELVITLTPKLRPENVDWDQIKYFKADNLYNLCMIFNPCHLFDINKIIQNFKYSIKNIMIISKLYDHQDVLRFVDQIENLAKIVEEINCLWIKVENWPIHNSDELEIMVNELNKIKSIVIRLEYKKTDKLQQFIFNPNETEFICNQWKDKNNCNFLEICKNKPNHNEWIQFSNDEIFDDPQYFNT